MKYFIGAFLVVVLITGYFLNKSNKEDAERLKQAEVAHQEKMQQEKVDAAQALDISNQQKIEVEKTKALKAEQEKINAEKQAKEFEQLKASQQETKQSEVALKNQTEESDVEKRELCSATMRLAKTIMAKRQDEISIEDVMKATQSANKATQKIGQALVISAYEQPTYSSESYKSKAIDSFGNDAYLRCIKAP